LTISARYSQPRFKKQEKDMANPRGPNYYNASYATTNETDLVTFQATNHYKAGLTALISSTAVGGTFKLYYIDPQDNAWLIDSVTVTANQLSVFAVDYVVPRGKVTFTASAATSSAVTCEVYGK